MATVAQRDDYEILGVPRDADDKAIKDAFRRLALKYHPDRSKEPDAEERFKEIAGAYAVLSDPRSRADYDAGGAAGLAGMSPQDLWATLDLDDIFGDIGFGLRSGLFERLFGRPAGRGPPRGADIEVSLTVPSPKSHPGARRPSPSPAPARAPPVGAPGAARHEPRALPGLWRQRPAHHHQPASQRRHPARHCLRDLRGPGDRHP